MENEGKSGKIYEKNLQATYKVWNPEKSNVQKYKIEIGWLQDRYLDRLRSRSIKSGSPFNFIFESNNLKWNNCN